MMQIKISLLIGRVAIALRFLECWILGKPGLARCHVPVYALNECLHHPVTGSRHMWQATQRGAGLGVVDCCVDEFNLL